MSDHVVGLMDLYDPENGAGLQATDYNAFLTLKEFTDGWDVPHYMTFYESGDISSFEIRTCVMCSDRGYGPFCEEHKMLLNSEEWP